MAVRSIVRSGAPRRAKSKVHRALHVVGVLGLMVGALAVAGSQPAFGATRSSEPSMAEWQQAIAQPANLSAGCYQVSYPSVQWHAVSCKPAPQIPLAPTSRPAAAVPAMTVGNGRDYSAVVPGAISSATGSFDGVSPTITEHGQFDGRGAQITTVYSLQLNTQFFKGSPACSKSSNPTCLAWQQFVYSSDTNSVFMQYWLITYDVTCPSGWFTYSVDCYTNSPSSTFAGGRITAPDLATTKLAGSASKGGNDEETLSFGGHATLVTNADSKIDLATFWNTAEFNVFGDAGGGEANFGSDTTFEAQTALTDGSSTAPACVTEGFTAETNNLTLTATPAIAAQPSPTIVFKQTNKSPTTASCAKAVGSALTVPQKPTPPHATAANKKAVVTWTADTTGGYPITKYTVTSSPGTKTCTWTKGPLTCTVAKLKNGTAYTFTLVATNKKGASPPSTASSPVTPTGKPARPKAPTVTAGNASVVVKWTKPATEGSAITRYVATSTTGSHSCTTTGALTCTVTTLTNGDPYKFRVVAHNANGTSPPSPYSVAATPKA